jgi:hypothetical protein
MILFAGEDAEQLQDELMGDEGQEKAPIPADRGLSSESDPNRDRFSAP